MLVHHLNCGSLRAITPNEGSGLQPKLAVSHCLLLESESGLVLVDSGIGSGDIAQPELSLGEQFLELSQPALLAVETAAEQVRALGYQISDVRHVVLTHLDLDHAGGISDFPGASVHVSVDELRAASAPGFKAFDRNRYRPLQWMHQPLWQPFDHSRGAEWFGFDTIEQPDGLPEEIRLVPLGGHSAGHTGVAVRLDPASDAASSWLMHAGDAYYYHAELDPDHPRSTPGLDYLATSTEVDRALRLGTTARLRDLSRRLAGQVNVFCAHDPWEFGYAQEAV